MLIFAYAYALPSLINPIVLARFTDASLPGRMYASILCMPYSVTIILSAMVSIRRRSPYDGIFRRFYIRLRSIFIELFMSVNETLPIILSETLLSYRKKRICFPCIHALYSAFNRL